MALSTRRILRDVAVVHNQWDRRPRPYPYDPTDTLAVTAGINPDDWGAWTLMIPKGTYNFGGASHLQILGLIVEDVSADDTYVVEIGMSEDALTFTQIAGVRFAAKGVPIPLPFTVTTVGSDVDNSINGIYGRVKCAGGGNSLTVSFSVARHISVAYEIAPPAGVWPYG